MAIILPQNALVIRPNNKISVFLVTGLKILGRVGTHILFILFFSGILPFKMHEIIFFSRKK